MFNLFSDKLTTCSLAKPYISYMADGGMMARGGMLVYRVNNEAVEKFLKKYPVVKSQMESIVSRNRSIDKGYAEFLKSKNRNEEMLGGREEVVSSTSLGTKTFYKYDWNGVSGWAEVYQYIHGNMADGGMMAKGGMTDDEIVNMSFDDIIFLITDALKKKTYNKDNDSYYFVVDTPSGASVFWRDYGENKRWAIGYNWNYPKHIFLYQGNNVQKFSKMQELLENIKENDSISKKTYQKGYSGLDIRNLLVGVYDNKNRKWNKKLDEYALGGMMERGGTLNDFMVVLKTPNGIVDKKDFENFSKEEIIEWGIERGWKYNKKGEKYGGQALKEDYEFFVKEKPIYINKRLPSSKIEPDGGMMSKGGNVKSLLKRFDDEKEQSIILGLLAGEVADDFERKKNGEHIIEIWNDLTDEEKKEYNENYKQNLRKFEKYLVYEFVKLYYSDQKIRNKCAGHSRRTIDAITSVMVDLAKKYPKDEYALGGMFPHDEMIAKTILAQLGGTGRLNAMTGAYNFIDLGNGVSFKIKNQRANYIKITLNSRDLYDVEVGRIRGTTYKVVKKQEDLYFDQLKGFLEQATGMYFSLKEGGQV